MNPSHSAEASAPAPTPPSAAEMRPAAENARSQARTPAFVIAISLCGGLLVGLVIGLLVGKGMPAPAPTFALAPAKSGEATVAPGALAAPASKETTTTLPKDSVHALSLGAVVDHEFRPEKQTTGRIANDDDLTTPVFTLAGGHVTRLLAAPGEMVAANQALAEIDSPDMFQAETALVQAIPALNKARLALEQLHRIATRQQKLFDLHAIALKDLEQSQADVRGAETDLAAAEAVRMAARGQLAIFGRSEAQIDALEHGGLPSRQAVVRAPIAGTVVSRKVGSGQVVRTDNADPMFTIADLSTVWMAADLYETDARWISIGQPVEVHVMAFPDHPYPATVSYISPSVDPNTHRITVRCTVENKDGRLKPEMFATFRMFAISTTHAPAVPVSAVIHAGAATYVWTAQDENAFTKHQVTCSPAQDGFVQIVSGLKTGDRIVLDGGIFLDN